jgi:hypothetical protein
MYYELQPNKKFAAFFGYPYSVLLLLWLNFQN